MVETVEIKQPETTSEQPVEEKSTQSKPEGLPEKFNSVEDLAKSYSELEKKLGEQTPTEEVDPTNKATLKEKVSKNEVYPYSLKDYKLFSRVELKESIHSINSLRKYCIFKALSFDRAFLFGR